jgi:hypothetical protein
MPIGTALSVLRQMLNAEAGEEMDEAISPARVSVNNQLLNNMQSFLVTQHAYLLGKTRVEVAAVVGQQYYTLPAGIDFDRVEEPEFINVKNFRYRLGFGIGQEEYNIFRSDLGVRASPVMRWDLVNNSGVLQIELWPIPSVAQTLMLAGTLPLTLMSANEDTCVVDDLVLILFTAAQLVAKHQGGDASAILAKAQAALQSIRASKPSKYDVFNIGGGMPRFSGFPYNPRRPVVAVNN